MRNEESVLHAEHVRFFDTFGFVVFDILDEVGRDTLELEVRTALSEAYPSYFDEHDNHFLPMMSMSTPQSLRLATSQGIAGIAAALLHERRPLVKPAKGASYRLKTYWHNDTMSRVPVKLLKLVTYLDGGGMEVVAASHRANVDSYLREILGSHVEIPQSAGILQRHGVPCHRIHLAPGQFLAFDVNLWHANHKAEHRLQWTVSFMSYPRSAEDRSAIVDHLGQFFDQNSGGGYDRRVYRYFPKDWESGESSIAMARNLTDSGVMADFLARYGSDR